MKKINWKAEYLLEWRRDTRKSITNQKYVKLAYAHRKYSKLLKQNVNFLQLSQFKEGYKPEVLFKLQVVKAERPTMNRWHSLTPVDKSARIVDVRFDEVG